MDEEDYWEEIEKYKFNIINKIMKYGKSTKYFNKFSPSISEEDYLYYSDTIDKFEIFP